MTSRWLMDEIRERSIAAKAKAYWEGIRRAVMFGQAHCLHVDRGVTHWLKTNKEKAK